MWWWFFVAIGAYVLVKVVLLAFWRQHIVWWEFLPGVVVTALCAFVSSAIDFQARTGDYQYRAGWVVSAHYYEDWDESYQVPEYDDEGNLTGYRTEVEYHPAYWEIQDSWGREESISQGQYRALVQKWSNESFVDLHRNYHWNDGDRYDTTYPGGDNLLVPNTWQEGYTNRTQAAPSLHNYPDVDTDQIPVYDYPKNLRLQCPSILGNATADEHRAFTLLNCQLGKQKDVHVWILIWEGEPMSTAVAQESHWKGGNRNEIVLCLGVDKNRRVNWSYVFGWTKSETLKAAIKNKVMDTEKLDLVALAQWMRPEIVRSFVARNMADFDYITIEPSNLALFLAFLFAVIAQSLLAVWLVKNEYTDAQPRAWRLRYRHRY